MKLAIARFSIQFLTALIGDFVAVNSLEGQEVKVGNDGQLVWPDGRVTDPAARKVPAWARDARWYEIDVPRFFNGEPGNDPAGTVPWFACEDAIRAGKGEKAAGEIELCKKASFGGDLQGVRAKIGYLKDLGVNTLYLDGIWGIEGHNVAPEVSAQGMEGDRVLVDLLADAHNQGVRVVLNSPPGKTLVFGSDDIETVMMKATKKWMDPNGDGEPSDGVDGWRAPGGGWVSGGFRRQWYEQVKRINPTAVVVDEDVATLPDGLPFYTTRTGARGSDPKDDGREAIRLWKTFCDRADRAAEWTLSLAVNLPDWPAGMRLITAVVQHFSPFAPWTVSGVEVGLDQRPPRPMWWIDMPGAKEELPDYRDDFRELIKWLHSRREHYPPIREGSFRIVMDDPAKRLFAFARTLPGDELIVLINYGSEKQKVYVPTGTPGRMIGVLVPHVATEKQKPKPGASPDEKPPPPKLVFRVNGSRQIADDKGEIRLWISPMSARVIVASDKGPY